MSHIMVKLCLCFLAASTIAYAEDSPIVSPRASRPNPMLARTVIAPLSVVVQLFPQTTQELETGINANAVGLPLATRIITYASEDGHKKVTISVDQYATEQDALSAYHQSVKKSELPGFTPILLPTMGQESFAGTLTKDAETHIGLGILEGTHIIGITLAGYEDSPENLAHLITLALAQDVAAKAFFHKTH